MMKPTIYILFVVLWCIALPDTIYAQNDSAQARTHFKKFIQYPVKKIIITSGSSGCFYFSAKEITFTLNSNGLYKSHFLSDCQKWDTSKKHKRLCIRSIESKTLPDILMCIDSNPIQLPLLSEFNLTNNCYSQARLDSMFLQLPCYGSTSNNFIRLELINSENDTIISYSSHPGSANPFWLPFYIGYNGQTFLSYNLAFAQFINKCIPLTFPHKKTFSKKRLLYKLRTYVSCADYDLFSRRVPPY